MSNIFYIERTARGVSGITLDSKLFQKRVLYLDSPIDDENVNDLIRALLVLVEEGDEAITIIIDSPGGSIQAGLALADVMESCSCIINTVALGMAASMAAILVAAGTKGHRYISEHSRLMIHEPLLQSGVSGSCTSIQATAKSIMERKQLINKLLADYTGKTEDVIEQATNFDNYMSATEAKKFGLVDSVVSGKELMSVLRGEELCI